MTTLRDYCRVFIANQGNVFFSEVLGTTDGQCNPHRATRERYKLCDSCVPEIHFKPPNSPDLKYFENAGVGTARLLHPDCSTDMRLQAAVTAELESCTLEGNQPFIDSMVNPHRCRYYCRRRSHKTLTVMQCSCLKINNTKGNVMYCSLHAVQAKPDSAAFISRKISFIVDSMLHFARAMIDWMNPERVRSELAFCILHTSLLRSIGQALLRAHRLLSRNPDSPIDDDPSRSLFCYLLLQ